MPRFSYNKKVSKHSAHRAAVRTDDEDSTASETIGLYLFLCKFVFIMCERRHALWAFFSGPHSK